MKIIDRHLARYQGLLRFFTGKPCSKGHIAPRSVSTGMCVECRTGHAKEWKKRNPERVAIGAANYHRRLRSECFAILGSACACCKETELVFLCIDHRNGGGNTHRRSLGIKQGTGGARFFKWILAETEKIGKRAIKKQFRILCHNCNAAHGILGYCPHKRRVQ